ncbi:hypothetical protein K449DRAFT_468791 [Hypoxylon sp. EC38]|nr:hypothetical protein K449DRAFT_468791 [Hypoxylon sp. EC38]
MEEHIQPQDHHPGSAEWVSIHLTSRGLSCSHFPKYNAGDFGSARPYPSRLGFFHATSVDTKLGFLDTNKLCFECLSVVVPANGFHYWSLFLTLEGTSVPKTRWLSTESSADNYPELSQIGSGVSSQLPLRPGRVESRPIAIPIPEIDGAKEAWRWIQDERKPFYIDHLHLARGWTPFAEKAAERDSAIVKASTLGSPFIPTVKPSEVEHENSLAQQKKAESYEPASPRPKENLIPSRPTKKAQIDGTTTIHGQNLKSPSGPKLADELAKNTSSGGRVDSLSNKNVEKTDASTPLRLKDLTTLEGPPVEDTPSNPVHIQGIKSKSKVSSSVNSSLKLEASERERSQEVETSLTQRPRPIYPRNWCRNEPIPFNSPIKPLSLSDYNRIAEATYNSHDVKSYPSLDRVIKKSSLTHKDEPLSGPGSSQKVPDTLLAHLSQNRTDNSIPVASSQFIDCITRATPTQPSKSANNKSSEQKPVGQRSIEGDLVKTKPMKNKQQDSIIKGTTPDRSSKSPTRSSTLSKSKLVKLVKDNYPTNISGKVKQNTSSTTYPRKDKPLKGNSSDRGLKKHSDKKPHDSKKLNQSNNPNKTDAHNCPDKQKDDDNSSPDGPETQKSSADTTESSNTQDSKTNTSNIQDSSAHNPKTDDSNTPANIPESTPKNTPENIDSPNTHSESLSHQETSIHPQNIGSQVIPLEKKPEESKLEENKSEYDTLMGAGSHETGGPQKQAHSGGGFPEQGIHSLGFWVEGIETHNSSAKGFMNAKENRPISPLGHSPTSSGSVSTTNTPPNLQGTGTSERSIETEPVRGHDENHAPKMGENQGEEHSIRPVVHVEAAIAEPITTKNIATDVPPEDLKANSTEASTNNPHRVGAMAAGFRAGVVAGAAISAAMESLEDAFEIPSINPIHGIDQDDFKSSPPSPIISASSSQSNSRPSSPALSHAPSELSIRSSSDASGKDGESDDEDDYGIFSHYEDQSSAKSDLGDEVDDDHSSQESDHENHSTEEDESHWSESEHEGEAMDFGHHSESEYSNSHEEDSSDSDDDKDEDDDEDDRSDDDDDDDEEQEEQEEEEKEEEDDSEEEEKTWTSDEEYSDN